MSLLVLLLSLSGLVRANDDAPSTVLHYFGTIGAVRSYSDQAKYVRDMAQRDGSTAGTVSLNPDTMVGIQLNHDFGDQLSAATQVVSRYRYDGTWRPEIMWAYANYAADTGSRLRVGRLGTDFYMLADARLLGYASLAVRPPLDFFGQLPLYHIDGVDFTHTIPMGEGLVSAKIFGGFTGERIPTSKGSWNLGDSPLLGANLDYHGDNWSCRVGYAQMLIKHDWSITDDLLGLGVPRATVDALAMGGKLARYYSFALMYDKGPLQVQWMANKVWQESFGYLFHPV